MIDINLLASKFRHIDIISLVRSLFEAFGTLWVIVSIGSFFSQGFSELISRLWYLFLIGGFLIGLYRSWPRLSYSCRILNTDCSVEIRVCNMFEQKADFVIASNTTFDTSIDDGIISKSSTQGQFTKRFCSSISQLDEEIDKSLTGMPYTELSSESKPFGKIRKYDIGTVASVLCAERRAYFVAIASLNPYRVANTDQQKLLDALPKLWEYIRTRGSIGPICCPILGSGFARLNATREELVREIIKSFVAASHESRFCEHLIISISPNDFGLGMINMRSLSRFLEYECCFGGSVNQPPTSKPIGVALKS